MKRKIGKAGGKGQRPKDLTARTAGAVTGGGRRRASSLGSNIDKAKEQIKLNQASADERLQAAKMTD